MERKALTLALAATVVAACAEPTGVPRLEDDATLGRHAPHHLVWDGDAAPMAFKGLVLRDNAGAIPQAPPTIITTSSAYAFSITKGQAATVEFYTVAFDLSEKLYIKLEFPANALAAWPDGKSIKNGESVQITARMDPATMVVLLEPFGLRMNSGVKITMSYGQASRDFDGDGVITSKDADIELNQLGLWRRQTPDGWWERISAIRDLTRHSFQGEVGALSGYALSW